MMAIVGTAVMIAALADSSPALGYTDLEVRAPSPRRGVGRCVVLGRRGPA